MEDNLIKAGRLAFVNALMDDQPSAALILPKGHTIDTVPASSAILINECDVTAGVDAIVYEVCLRMRISEPGPAPRNWLFVHYWQAWLLGLVSGCVVGKFLL